MTYRNGIVADTLRQAGMAYPIIFGLQLPQLSEIARSLKAERGEEECVRLADELWADRNVRESRLLACWLFPLGITEEKALQLAESVQTREEADILAFRLLRRLLYAESLRDRLRSHPDSLVAYCGEALQRNLDA